MILRVGLHRTSPILPERPYDYTTVRLPAYSSDWAHCDNTPGDNPLTNEGATLGRVLFYDTRLSANNSTSCRSVVPP